MYSSTTKYQMASLKILPTGKYNLPFIGHKNPYLSSLLVTCHQSSRLYGVIKHILYLSSINRSIIQSIDTSGVASPASERRSPCPVVTVYYAKYHWRSQDDESATHIKGGLLDQARILFNCVPFQMGTSLIGKNLLLEAL